MNNRYASLEAMADPLTLARSKLPQIEGDALWQLLNKGEATKDDQHRAADWIKWMFSFVTPKGLRDRQLGIVNHEDVAPLTTERSSEKRAPMAQDTIKWALHRNRENKARFEVGLDNLTIEETSRVFAVLMELQGERHRAEKQDA
jgi:hypothetical protein